MPIERPGPTAFARVARTDTSLGWPKATAGHAATPLLRDIVVDYSPRRWAASAGHESSAQEAISLPDPQEPTQIGVSACAFLPVRTMLAHRTSAARAKSAPAVLSLLIPGAAQWLSGRRRTGAIHLVIALVLWLVGLGWFMHIYSFFDAMRLPRPSERPSVEDGRVPFRLRPPDREVTDPG